MGSQSDELEHIQPCVLVLRVRSEHKLGREAEREREREREI